MFYSMLAVYQLYLTCNFFNQLKELHIKLFLYFLQFVENKKKSSREIDLKKEGLPE